MGAYDTGYLIGAALGALSGLVVVVFLLKFMKKDGKLKCKYDERQERIRGRGFKYGFFTYLIFLAMDALYGNYLEQFVDRGLIAFFGMLLGIIVYAGYAIWNDGYFSLNENPVRVIVVFAVIMLFNFGEAGYSFFMYKDIVEDGVLSMHALPLLCGITMLIMIFLILVKSACKKGLEEG